MRIFILCRIPKLPNNSCYHHRPNYFGLFRKSGLMHRYINSFIKFRKRILPKQITFINHLATSRADVKIVKDKLE